MQIKYLDGRRLYRGLLAGGKAVVRNQKYLDKINVFPVADADTGANLAFTMQAIMQNSRIGSSVKETIISVADSALNGAKGNSGIIFAQYLHGLSHELPEKGVLTVKHFAESANKAVKHLYNSLMNPVEGTMLTVIREWAENMVEQSRKTSDFLHVLTDSLLAARKSLAETPQKLQVLADAGVVDAGACGFVNFLEGVVDYIHKGSLRETIEIPVADAAVAPVSIHTETLGSYRYCTEAILTGFHQPLELVKERIGTFGDSLILAGGQTKLHIHIHTNEPDAVFSMLFSLGTVTNPKVDDMYWQNRIANHRKYPIGIVTDTACDLPRNILDEYQIAQIPFGISFGDRFYLDKLGISSEAFYSRLKTDKVHPVSSQATPKGVQDVLDIAARCFEKVIVVHISEKLSGMYQTTWSLARQKYDGKVSVLNSRQLSVSEGLVTLRIARAIKAGVSYNAILDSIPQWISDTLILTDIDTLKYMVKGGRVKPLTGFIASVLNLKPIVSLDKDGKAIAYGKSFSRKSNMRKIVGIIAESTKQKRVWEYAIVHADAPDIAQQYAAELTGIIGKKPAYIMPLSPVVGVHNGIGAVGIGVSYDKL
jgi:DegV family protein with EDD domain